jgi:alkylation response protein AidB-like acyl-CoA dehydrogenase
MYFGFGEQERLMQKSVRDLLERECTPVLLRGAWTHRSGRIDGLWAKLGELGVLGILIGEAHGGLGLGELELALVMEEAGRAALPEPLLETAAVGAPLLAESEHRDAAGWLERIAAGNARLSLAFDIPGYAAYADSADLLIAERGGVLFGVDPRRAELVAEASVDGSRRLFRASWTIGSAFELASGEKARSLLQDARDRAAFAASAELVGLGARMLSLSVEYVTARKQFGRAIGSFQAVQHQLAEALVELEFARPLVYRAAYSLARRDEARSLHASMAKAAASDAAHAVARAALQVHGAIGYSYEYELHLYMKRAWALGGAWGDAAAHLERCAEKVIDGRGYAAGFHP